jgi:hypothetical protein
MAAKPAWLARLVLWFDIIPMLALYKLSKGP